MGRAVVGATGLSPYRILRPLIRFNQNPARFGGVPAIRVEFKIALVTCVCVDLFGAGQIRVIPFTHFNLAQTARFLRHAFAFHPRGGRVCAEQAGLFQGQIPG